MNKPRPLSELFCLACISAAAAAGPDTGRVINERPPGGASGELLHCSIITSTAAAADDDDDGDRIRGITVAAAAAALVSIGGLEMTERLIISVSTLSYTTTSPHCTCLAAWRRRWSYQRSYSTSNPVSTGMGDVSGFDSRRRHFISVCNQPPRLPQPFILSRLIN